MFAYQNNVSIVHPVTKRGGEGYDESYHIAGDWERGNKESIGSLTYGSVGW